jgi:hypothetical protein
VGIGGVTHDIDVFEAGVAIQPDVAQILSEKSETFAEKKDSDEPENNNGDERVTPEEGLDEIVGTPAANRQGGGHWRRGDNFSHSSIMPPWQWWRQMPKCYVYVTTLFGPTSAASGEEEPKLTGCYSPPPLKKVKYWSGA